MTATQQEMLATVRQAAQGYADAARAFDSMRYIWGSLAVSQLQPGGEHARAATLYGETARLAEEWGASPESVSLLRNSEAEQIAMVSP